MSDPGRGRKGGRALAWALLGVAALSWAGTAEGARDTLRLRIQDELISLDPAHTAQPSDHVPNLSIYDGLVRIKPGTTEVEPNLAERWELSPDGTTYTFHLRRGIKWHRGQGAVTARDFKYSFERIRDPQTKSRYRRYLAPVKDIEVVDDHTLRIRLKSPYPSFLTAVLAFRPGWVVNRGAIEKWGKQYTLHPIGTGPYMFERWVRGSEIVLVRNPDYYLPVRIPRLVIKVIRDDSVARLALESGELDVAYFYEGSTIKAIKEGGKLQVPTLPGFRTHWLSINLRRKALQDLRLRQAILHATNKKDIVDHVFYGYARAVHSIFNPNLSTYYDTEANAYDPEKARRLLREAGYPNGIDLDFLVLPITNWPPIAAVLQDQWRRVGIRAKLKTPERAIYNQLRNKGEFDVAGVAITRVDPDQYAHEYLHSSNIPASNYSAYRGADDLIEAARREFDPRRRAALYKEFQLRIARDLPGFAVVNVHYAVAAQPYVRGLTPVFMDSYPVWQMYFDERRSAR